MPFKGIDWKTEIHNAVELGKEGHSLQKIADHYGVSRQRIKQVFKQYHVDPDTVGVKIQAQKTLQEKAVKHFEKWGDKQQTDLYRAQREKFHAKKANAKRAGWEWDVSFGDIDWPTRCPILGIELDYFAEYRQENSPSFDRLDPAKGYVSGNVQVLSWRANRIKNDGSADEHRKIADYLDGLTSSQ